VIGSLGATIGVLAGRRKGRRLVLSQMVVLLLAGICSLLTAEPLRGRLRRRIPGNSEGYEEAELRKMHALRRDELATRLTAERR
jgi:hypothetical protein